MKLMSDAMSCQFTDNTVTEALRMLLYRRGDITDTVLESNLFESFPKALFRDTDQLLCLFRDLSYGKGSCRIRVKSVAESIRKEQAEEMYEVLES